MPTLVENFIEIGREGMRQRLKDQPYITTSSEGARQALIANYTAAIAINFTDWMGKTLPWVRHELSRFVIIDNLRCETVEDHATMLEKFAEHCNATPTAMSYSHVNYGVRTVRGLFYTPYWAGLSGIALLALLENTSMDFIPVLKQVAGELRCPFEHQKYIRIHGEADITHSEQFLKALEAEASMGYGDQCAPILGMVQSTANCLFDGIFGKF